MTSGNASADEEERCWESLAERAVRTVLARHSSTLARGHATPFLRDMLPRDIFTTVTLDDFKED